MKAANASRIASAFGVTAAASTSVAANHVEVVIGAGTTTVPTISERHDAEPLVVAGHPTTGPQGGAVGAEKGIPCVNDVGGWGVAYDLTAGSPRPHDGSRMTSRQK